MSDGTEELWKRVLTGDVRAASRLMREIEDGLHRQPDLEALFPHTGKAHVIGITGAPGVGKSTLTSKLIASIRGRNQKVGVLAVDPTSPLTGGALLGDRIRMQEHALDLGVFIRSMATRGHLGGLARAAADCIQILDAMGQDIILVETVGVGQAELEISALAHTTVVVLTPGMGDEVQALKAGILEVADLFVVNKSDQPGADKTVHELRQMLDLRRKSQVGSAEDAWEPDILKTSAVQNGGTLEVLSAIGRHKTHLETTDVGRQKNLRRATEHLLVLLRDELLQGALSQLERARGSLAAVANDIVDHRLNPYSLANGLARQFSEGG